MQNWISFIFHLRYDQAADALRREICLNQQTESYQAIGKQNIMKVRSIGNFFVLCILGRLAVALVLVQLARGDSVAAEKAFKEWGNCCDVNEVQTLEMLLQVWLKWQRQQIYYCENHFSIIRRRMMMKIRIWHGKHWHHLSLNTWMSNTLDLQGIFNFLKVYRLHRKLTLLKMPLRPTNLQTLLGHRMM